ncbi:FAD:protein FMN transferase [Bacteriovorax sp. Seq25_V]|uniref:FAD:protein FMN transferase n=1 Tax=Bacteriovorax sp. Seq25_V TaxID=1201288 RepID=UPI00038A30AC|nr:FAD:protein FMN transferase [Bacteriovorax sp. Seq25_V]EQC47493.1 ApbE family protein [Bacteriovorax sp. Seq25_V]
MIHKEERFMNSTFTIKSYDKISDCLLSKAFSLISDFEKKYTVFHPSFFNNLNEYAGKRSIDIDDETIELFDLSKKYYDLSDGLFNIAFQTPKYSFNDIEINVQKKTAYLPYPDMKISLGGIGKGYIVDKVFHFLKEEGVQNFYINGGGDLRVASAPHSPRPWRIGISNPFNSENTVGHVALTNQAFATSGTYIKGNHIQTFTQDEKAISISILSSTTVDADIMATIGLTKSIVDAKLFYDTNDIWATIIDNSGKVFLTKKALSTHYK